MKITPPRATVSRAGAGLLIISITLASGNAMARSDNSMNVVYDIPSGPSHKEPRFTSSANRHQAQSQFGRLNAVASAFQAAAASTSISVSNMLRRSIRGQLNSTTKNDDDNNSGDSILQLPKVAPSHYQNQPPKNTEDTSTRGGHIKVAAGAAGLAVAGGSASSLGGSVSVTGGSSMDGIYPNPAKMKTQRSHNTKFHVTEMMARENWSANEVCQGSNEVKVCESGNSPGEGLGFPDAPGPESCKLLAQILNAITAHRKSEYLCLGKGHGLEWFAAQGFPMFPVDGVASEAALVTSYQEQTWPGQGYFNLTTCVDVTKDHSTKNDEVSLVSTGKFVFTHTTKVDGSGPDLVTSFPFKAKAIVYRNELYPIKNLHIQTATDAYNTPDAEARAYLPQVHATVDSPKFHKLSANHEPDTGAFLDKVMNPGRSMRAFEEYSAEDSEQLDQCCSAFHSESRLQYCTVHNPEKWPTGSGAAVVGAVSHANDTDAHHP